MDSLDLCLWGDSHFHWRFPAEHDTDLIDSREEYIEQFPDSRLAQVFRKEIAFMRWISGELTKVEAESLIDNHGKAR